MTTHRCDIHHPAQPAFTLQRDAWRRLVLLDAEGGRHDDVTLVRMFPLTDPGRWIALVDGDGHELLAFPDLDAMESEARQIVEDELRRCDFLPVVRRIVHVSSDEEPCTWNVETDRGRTTFQLDGEENIRRLGSDDILLADTHGVRYRIADPKGLDLASRRFLERYL